MDREPLHYMPLRHVRRRPYWKKTGLPTAVLAAFLAGTLVCFGARMSSDTRVFVGVCAATFACIAVMAVVNWREAWEYRVEGGTLTFRRPFDRGWATIQLDEIGEVVQLRGPEDDWDYEMVFHGGQRILLPASTFGPVAEFQRQLLTIRPDMRFGRRRTGECGQCGRDLHGGNDWRALWVVLRTRRCNHCGARLAGRLRRIPAGGTLLPDALDW